jgi:hypothetical protein
MMVAIHLQMLLCEMEKVEEASMPAIPIYFDSNSAIAIGVTKTPKKCHIMIYCHYVREQIQHAMDSNEVPNG